MSSPASAPGEPPTSVLSDASLKRLLKLAAEVLAPAGVATALAFYFGWARTRKLYRELGVDDSLLGFDTRDYVMRSLGVLLDPIPVMTVAAAGFVVVVVLARVEVRRHGPPMLGLLVSMAIVVPAVTWFAVERSTAAGSLGVLGALLFGTALLVAVRPDPVLRRWAGASPGVVLGLVALTSLFGARAAFEAVRLHAEDAGVRLATEIEAHPERFRCVRVTTPQNIPVGELLATEVDGDGRTLNTFGGLRLFIAADERLLVWSERNSPRSGLFALPLSEVVTFDLAPQRTSGEWCRTTFEARPVPGLPT